MRLGILASGFRPFAEPQGGRASCPPLLVIAFGICGFTTTAAWATEYEIDPAHSSVSFRIRHLVSKTTGKFDKFKGNLTYERGKPETWKVSAAIEADSINTNAPKRDSHLRSPDFFDVAKYPEITFKSGRVVESSESGAKVAGTLTIHGVSKPVVLDVDFGGEGKDPMGTRRAGFTARTKIDRRDFGLKWNKALETGGFMVGDDVEISIEIEGMAGGSKT